MLQKILALLLIGFFLVKLLWQQRQRRISWLEFSFWLIFWIISALAVLSLSQIDSLVAKLGFSGNGIDVLLYVGVAVCFYFISRMRIKLEKYERQLTQLVSLMAKQSPLIDNQENKDE
jgi:hypothetical protein